MPRRSVLARNQTSLVITCEVVIVLAVLAAWQWLPQIPWVRENTFLDPFVISSPQLVGQTLWDLLSGTNGRAAVWSFVWPTVTSSLVGLVIGLVLGALVGLLLSNSPFVNRVLRPFLVGLNAVPRVAIIPVVVIIFGPGYEASVFNAIMVVFFVAFFNAYEGGRTVTAHLLENAQVLGASKGQIMATIRLPYVFAWTVAALPLAATFSLLVVVTGEILTGANGMGKILSVATVSVDSATTFAVVIILAVLGVAIVGATSLIERRILHWWGK
ncbi:ABC transporter permease [Pseudonocardia sp. RS010]|uniref:ABC transporter permease n=1 Tax=Pseudonocardia sp. RS010 TaxID=3385979 RepID=UPI0039A34926